MATHSSVLAWRIPGMGEPGGLPSMGSHRIGHDWSDLVAGISGKGTRRNLARKPEKGWNFRSSENHGLYFKTSIINVLVRTELIPHQSLHHKLMAWAPAHWEKYTGKNSSFSPYFYDQQHPLLTTVWIPWWPTEVNIRLFASCKFQSVSSLAITCRHQWVYQGES